MSEEVSSCARVLIPHKTIYRLSIYHRCLARLADHGHETVSSAALARAAGVKPAQLRRDLSFVGQFGKRGLGYRVGELRRALREALGRLHLQPVILVGVGNLGSALSRYNGFQREGFELIGAFDSDPQSALARDVTIPIYGIEEVEPFIIEHKVKMAILCIPAEHAQSAANDLVHAGITGILNFSPTVLQVPDHVTVNQVDMALELEHLSFFVSQRGDEA